MLYDRNPFTPWVIEVLGEEDENRYEGFYRTTMRDGKECEQFTLMLKDSDITLVQVRLYKNGDVLTGCFVPANVVVYKGQKKVTVDLMCDAVVENGSLAINMKPEWTE